MSSSSARKAQRKRQPRPTNGNCSSRNGTRRSPKPPNQICGPRQYGAGLERAMHIELLKILAASSSDKNSAALKTTAFSGSNLGAALSGDEASSPQVPGPRSTIGTVGRGFLIPRCRCGTQFREVEGDLWCPACNSYKTKEAA